MDDLIDRMTAPRAPTQPSLIVGASAVGGDPVGATLLALIEMPVLNAAISWSPDKSSAR
jgi:hypothetical protein